MKKSILYILCFLFALVSSAQETFKPEKQIGINAGFTTGYGFSGKIIGKKLGIQATFLPYKTDYEKYISAGITGFYFLKRSRMTKQFLYLGNHFTSTYRDNEENVGFGWGFTVGTKVQHSIMVGYGAYDVTDSFGLLPTLETSLFINL